MLEATQEFVEWTDGASDEELEMMEKITTKEMWKWILVSIVPFVNIFTVGIAMFCYNNLCYLKSRGHKVGNRWIMALMLVWGLFLVPLIEINIFQRNELLGNHILGWI